MEQLKRITEVCRQHYEKLVLVLALLILAGAVYYLYSESQKEKQTLEDVPKDAKKPKGKLLPTVNLAPFLEAARDATNPPIVNLSGGHNTFNPVKWQVQRAGEEPVKVTTGTEIGPASCEIVRVTPLNLSIAYDRAAISGTPPDIQVTGYHIVATNELATVPRLRRVTQFVQPNATNTQVFILTEIKGPKENPTELVATLRDFGNETISFAPNKPYSRAVGYEAELKYPSQGRTYPRLRKESAVDIDGESYKVVDITPTRVVLSDDSNGKRYGIVKFAAPATP
jgi:hypothetical protein